MGRAGRRRRVPHSIPGLLDFSSAGYINVVLDVCHSGGLILHMNTRFSNDKNNRAKVTVGAVASQERESQAFPGSGGAYTIERVNALLKRIQALNKKGRDPKKMSVLEFELLVSSLH